MADKRAKRLEAFKVWLRDRGAEVLEPTSEWELIRFRAEGAVGIIYRNKSEALKFTTLASRAWNAFEKSEQGFRFGEATPRKQRHRRDVLERTLIARDGPGCFYCGCEFSPQRPWTKEHLIALTAQGPDHISNLFLSCKPCNEETSSMSAPEKIRFRDRKRRGAGTILLCDLRPHVAALSVTDEDPEYKALLARLDAIIHQQRAKEPTECRT